MATNTPPSSSLPSSMGPGAHPVDANGGNRNVISEGMLKEISDIRSKYSINVDADNLNLGYDLKGRQRHFRIPFDNIPLSGIKRSMLYSGPASVLRNGTETIDLIRGVENIGSRDLNQSEAEAFAYHTSKRAWGMFLWQSGSMAAGIAIAWRNRKAMKFPFKTPKPIETYDKFPTQQFSFLSGARARTAWHMTRANVWVFLMLFAVAPIAQSMTQTSLAVGLYRDPRTKDLFQGLTRDINKLAMNRASAAGSRPGKQNASTGDSPYSDQDFYSGDGQGDATFTDVSTDTGIYTDSGMQQQEARQQSPSAWSRARSKDKSQPSQPQQSSSDPFFNIDDASPTAGNDTDMTTSGSYQQRATGSAWDNLRRGNTSSSPTPRSRYSGGQDSTSKMDTFSFSNEDQDKQLAKEQAQQEFDRMLEQERKQGGSDDYIKGMQATEFGNESSTPSSQSGSAWDRLRKR